MTAQVIETAHRGYLLSTDKGVLDLDVIHQYISETSYWALGRPRDITERAIEGSGLVIGAYSADKSQVGFARMITDFATWAYLCDVFVLPDHQGTGLGTAMVKAIVDHPDVVDIRTQFLATADAHELYAKFGYTPLEDPNRWMHRRKQAWAGKTPRS